MLRNAHKLARRAGALLLAASAVSHSFAYAADSKPMRFDGHAIVRASIDSPRALQTMLALSPDCWSESPQVGPNGGTLDFRIPPDRMNALLASGITYEVLIANVQVELDRERAHSEAVAQREGGIAGAGEFFDDYRNTLDIHAYLTSLIDAYPMLMHRELAGTSIEGRDIWAYVITSPVDIDKRAICVNSGAHAREWIGPATACWLITELLNGYANDEQITGLVDELEWHVIPVINPDGYEFSRNENRLWRKTRRDNGDGSWGVDWNRNFDANWGGEGASGSTSSDIYYGTAPFSEPETQALRDWILANPHTVAHVDVHSYSQLMLHPYGYDNTVPDGADGGALAAIARDMVDAIYASDGKSYTPQPAHALYIASGTSLDWSYDGANCISMTPELRDTGEYGFVLPADQIHPTATEMFQAFKILGEAVRAKMHVSMPFGWPGELEAGVETPVAFLVAPTWNRNSPIGTATLDTKIGDGDWESFAMENPGSGLFTGMLPPVSCDETIFARLTMTSSNGSMVTWPNDDPLSSVAHDFVVLFNDNFETDLGWTVVNDSSLTDGAFARGMPLGGGDRGDPTSDFDGSGQCYLTNPADGNTDVDGGGTELVSPLLDGSQPGSELVYARWYSNNFGGAPFEDVMQIDVSPDGGTTWLALETVGPGGEEAAGGWYQRRFDLNLLPGIGNTNTLRVRFRAEDTAGGSVVEAAVDSVRIERTACAGNPSDINGDGSVNGKDLTILLGSWGACAGCAADLNGDGIVDGADLTQLLGEWG